MHDLSTADDFEAEKYELIGGEEIMLAAASIPHLRIQGHLYNKIYYLNH